MKAIRTTLASLLLFSCAERQPETSARIDHVIVGVSDLSQGMDEIEQLTGIRPGIGGAHPGGGTQNALMSLGENRYLEILAPNPAEQVASAEVEQLRHLARPTPIGWAVSAGNERALRTALASQGFELTSPESGSRRKPDGSILRWVTFGFANLDHPLAPFFIQWSDPALHPSRNAPGGCLLKSILIEDPAADQLRAGIEPLGVKVAVRTASGSRMLVDLSCPGGSVTLGN